MKLLVSNDWLKRKILADPDCDAEAGPPLTEWRNALEVSSAELRSENVAVIGDRKAVELRIALGVLIKQLRLRKGLSVAELAARAEIAESELRQVEHDPHFTARPRLIFKLSKFFDVSMANLSQMSGATHAVDRSLYNNAVKYAACSEDLSKLTDQQRETLDVFVATLKEKSDTL